jgi:uncharacterized membrane protein HdeD (DUF308 family)
MIHSLARNWWFLALRGAVAILFGVLAFLWPAVAWLVVVASFAAFALLDGVLAVALAVTGHGQGRQWWALVLQGLLGISAGVLTLIWPELTEFVLLFFIAFWAMATGVFAVIAAVRLRKEIEGEWALALSGILSVLFGLSLVLFPNAGALAIAWIIAAYSIAFGILLLMVALRLRSLVRHYPQGPRPAAYS